MIPIPARMKHLKVARDMAVPYGVMIDSNGTPIFSINDEPTRLRSIRRNLCAICGKSLLRGRWLVGGALSAFHPRGAFIDPAMHYECSHYALQVCPYMAVPNYNKMVGPKQFENNRVALAGVVVLPGYEEQSPGSVFIKETPEVFIAIMTTDPIVYHHQDFSSCPQRPYSTLEYWRGGVMIERLTGVALKARMLDEERRALDKVPEMREDA